LFSRTHAVAVGYFPGIPDRSLRREIEAEDSQQAPAQYSNPGFAACDE
jgi:hypothetical protein